MAVSLLRRTHNRIVFKEMRSSQACSSAAPRPRPRYSGSTPSVAIQARPSLVRTSAAIKPTIWPSQAAFSRTTPGKVSTPIRSRSGQASNGKQTCSRRRSAPRSRMLAVSMSTWASQVCSAVMVLGEMGCCMQAKPAYNTPGYPLPAQAAGFIYYRPSGSSPACW